jgi:hypothetical protein
VNATARTAGNLGFRTMVVCDAPFAVALANLQGEYATVVKAQALIT